MSRATLLGMFIESISHMEMKNWISSDVFRCWYFNKNAVYHVSQAKFDTRKLFLLIFQAKYGIGENVKLILNVIEELVISYILEL